MFRWEEDEAFAECTRNEYPGGDSESTIERKRKKWMQLT